MENGKKGDGMMTPAMDELVKQDRLAQHLGMEIVELEVGRAKVKMEAKAEHCNGLGIVHGGTSLRWRILRLRRRATRTGCRRWRFTRRFPM